LADQAESACVVRAKKEMQERIPTGVPFHPAVFPVRPSVIASVVAKNFHGPRLARRVSRIKNKLRAAFRASRSILDAGFFLLFRSAHGKVRLKTRSREASAKEPGSTPVLKSPVAVDVTLRTTRDPWEMNACDGIGMYGRSGILCICIVRRIFAGRTDPARGNWDVRDGNRRSAVENVKIGIAPRWEKTRQAAGRTPGLRNGGCGRASLEV
jgi:hypothetical protein